MGDVAVSKVAGTFTPIGAAAAGVVAKLAAKEGNVERIPINSRADWLTLRRRDVTASDIAALFGCHPYRTVLQVFADKIGQGVDRGDNELFRRGRILEPAVAAAVSEERKEWLIAKATDYLRDPELRLGATPDWFATDARGVGIIETKTADPSIFDRDWQSGPPLAWTLQCLVQMMLADAAWGAVAVLVTSRDFPVYIYDVPRHPIAEAKIVAKVREFWRSVDSGEQPPFDFARDAEIIAAMFPKERDASVDLGLDNRLPEILARRAELAGQIKAAEAEKSAIDAEIKTKLGENAKGHLPGWRISWTTRAGYVAEVKPARVLRVTDLRAKENAA